MLILTLNAGSSSIKYKVYLQTDGALVQKYGGLIEGIGERRPHSFASHLEAYHYLHEQLKDTHIDVVAHRVVHGGDDYFKPTVITSRVRNKIRDLCKLAPIHNPLNLEGIDFAMDHYPNAIQIAIFDTGFHHHMPEEVRKYPISREVAHRYNILKYGFHGINHEYVTKTAAQFLGFDDSQSSWISLHLGNGASGTLVVNGHSKDTSMGMTPLAGLMMGTRCGDIDPAIVLYLMQAGFTYHDIDTTLNKKSGLLGIAKDNDMRHLLARRAEGDMDASLAICMYVYRIQSLIGSYLAHTRQLNGIIFTGGVGENASAIREEILVPLHHLGFHLDSAKNNLRYEGGCWRIDKGEGIPILVVRGDEERHMATLAAELVERSAS